MFMTIMTVKPIEYGSGIVVKEIDDKILICAENKTRLKESNFSLEAHEIIIEAGKGVKISSKGKDTLVISVDTTKQDEKIYDMQQEMDRRLTTIEKIFLQLKKVKS